MIRTFMSRSTITSAYRVWWRWLVLVPEAPLLAVVVVLAALLQFPPWLGLLATGIALWFVMRCALLFAAEDQLARRTQHTMWLVRMARRMHPWSVDALLLEAHSALQNGQQRTAEHVIRRAAQIEPANDNVRAAQAHLLLARGGTPRLPTLTPQRRVSPALLLHYAHQALHTEHDATKAVKLLARAQLDRLPPSASTPLLLLVAEAHIGLEHYHEAHIALQSCEALLERCPRGQRAEALYQMGRLWNLMGKNGVVYFRRSVELDSNGPYAHAAWRSAVMGE